MAAGRGGAALTYHLLVNGRHLSAHADPAGAGRRLAGFYVGGPTPFTARLYKDGRPAPRADSDEARNAAAEAVVEGGRTQQ